MKKAHDAYMERSQFQQLIGCSLPSKVPVLDAE
jgi:hypothetical protein